MKKVFITLAIIIVLIIVTLMVIPVFFKSDILRLIEEKSSKYIQAELAIGNVHLSMFKNFPNLSVSLDNVVISKEETNTRDTLINIPLPTYLHQSSSFRGFRKFTFLNFR